MAFLPSKPSAAFIAANPHIYGHQPPPKVSNPEPLKRQEQLGGDHAGKAQGTGRVALRFELRRVHLLDPCAKYGSCKALIDGLRYAGLIHNDREEDITLEVIQEKVAHYEDEETLIQITYPMMNLTGRHGKLKSGGSAMCVEDLGGEAIKVLLDGAGIETMYRKTFTPNP
tara:strand:+ start:357 stop:866 length:510 start_codon:yes stop_codon:yes gene_type:complete